MSRQPKVKARFYAPVADVDGLARLEGDWLRGRTVFLRLLWGVGALALLLIALNLVGTAFDATAPRAQRTWSLFPVLSLALALTPLAARDLWLRPRALRAQRRLLGHRGLLGRESDIRARELRIADGLFQASSVDPGAETALAAARAASSSSFDELSRLGIERRRAGQPAAEADLAERGLIARLDAYGEALGTITITIALDDDFVDSSAVTEALERAVELLDPAS